MKPTAPPRPAPTSSTAFNILTNPDRASLKRVAWAYGCSKKGSDEERQLFDILVDKARLRVNSIGTCTRCGYEGPGPAHDCKGATP